MLSEELIKFSNEVSSKIYFDYDLKKSTWFNIGGKAKIFLFFQLAYINFGNSFIHAEIDPAPIPTTIFFP